MSDYDYDFYLAKLKDHIGEKRYQHSLRVYEMAKKLNTLGLDGEKVKKASLFHDCAKYNERIYYEKYKDKYGLSEKIFESPSVSHAFLGAIVAKEEYNINNEEILGAIKYHTTGRAGMTDLEKLVFLADGVEEGRNYPGVDQIREAAFESLDKGLLMSLDHTLKFLIDKKAPIYPLTIETRNYLIKEKNE